uniref:Uncharacterized protein n=1 Tax=Anopheles arabiensis TaxID=7173 RepID=A0A182IFK6_ANOAR
MSSCMQICIRILRNEKRVGYTHLIGLCVCGRTLNKSTDSTSIINYP